MPTIGSPRTPDKLPEGLRKLAPREVGIPSDHENPPRVERTEQVREKEKTENIQSPKEQKPVEEGLISRIRKPKVIPQVKPITRDEITRDVEHIMSEGLTEAFKALSPIKQQEFKMKGEETAREIRSLLFSTKVKMKKIFELIFDWLKLLPGVNKFFLEQEAKIKAERVMRLKELKNFRP